MLTLECNRCWSAIEDTLDCDRRYGDQRELYARRGDSTDKLPKNQPNNNKSETLERDETRQGMKLLTHNMLSSNIKGVKNGFPLHVEAEKVVKKEVVMNPDFLKNMFVKVEWKALVGAAKSMGYADLPDEANTAMLDSDEFLGKFHHALLELDLEEGALVCPETGRRFPVNRGIPNMLLHEDEV